MRRHHSSWVTRGYSGEAIEVEAGLKVKAEVQLCRYDMNCGYFIVCWLQFNNSCLFCFIACFEWHALGLQIFA